MNRTDRRSLLRKVVGVALLPLAGLAAAADRVDAGDGAAAESYAVVALVGDRISVVRYRPTVGSSLDQNRQVEIPLEDDHFDRLATGVALDAIRRAAPQAEVEQVRVAERTALGEPGSLLEPDGRLPALIAAVRPGLRRADTHYLVVMSKYRGDAHLRAANGSLGSGKLSGLGFYIDAETRMRRTESGETGRGFVAPYAYVTVTLVDLRTGALVRSEDVVETSTQANVGTGTDLDPWNALTAEQKVRLLDRLLASAVQKTVQHVVAPG